MKKKLFIIGGHLSPALAVIDEIQQHFPDWQIVFVGRKYAMEIDNNVSIEYKAITERNIRFLSLTTGRLQRFFSAMTIVSLFKIPIGFFQSLFYCVTEKPDLIVSFGGYLALPVVVAGKITGIPSITHEQTLIPGLTNRIIAQVVSKICVTFPETVRFFPKQKTVVTGMPIRNGLWFVKTGTYAELEQKKYPILYITGGTTGAVSLNDLLFPIVNVLTKKYVVIHQTGFPSFDKAQHIKHKLPCTEGKRYIVEPYIDGNDVAWILRHAALIINRSGANTIIEIAAFGAISLSIPLPWSAGNEQLINARWLAKFGAAEVLDQKTTAPYDVLRAVSEMMSKRRYYKNRADRLSARMPRDGVKRMVSEIDRLL
jgi:UDP-N-acetylglucosamine--N-acetylmuramyl-(pentapeptide) pyrophosphoryl-undecaprenol N-acetylglucosamine transferase